MNNYVFPYGLNVSAGRLLAWTVPARLTSG